MAVTPREATEALAERENDVRVVLDRWGFTHESYTDWKERQALIDDYIADRFVHAWPDGKKEQSRPYVPNLVKMASEYRARLVSSLNPSIVRRPRKAGEEAKNAAEKVERILAGYWEHNQGGERPVPLLVPQFAHDAMHGGVCAVKVLPDFSKPPGERFPNYIRLNPRFLYPEPLFSPGPFLTSAIYAYEEKARVVAEMFKAKGEMRMLREMAKRKGIANPDRVRVIQYLDDMQVLVIAQALGDKSKALHITLVDEQHELGRCPVAVGVRPSPDGKYRGDFDSMLAILDTWHKFMVLHTDAASQAVYPATLDFDVENPEEYGPDAQLRASSPNARFEIIQHPGANFSNHQIMRQLADSASAASLMPPAAQGDPNESIISAAGISAATSPVTDHVRSLQRHTIAPLLQAANELAMRGDEKHADVPKTVSGVAEGAPFSETYRASEVFGGDYSNEVVYGPGAGLDEINQHVMVTGQLQARMIDKETAMELSPFVRNPVETKKKLLLEDLTEATMAGLIAQAQAGALSSDQLASIEKAVADEDMTLREAILAVTNQAPMASPEQPEALPGAPGIAGAGRGQQSIRVQDLLAPGVARPSVTRTGTL